MLLRFVAVVSFAMGVGELVGELDVSDTRRGVAACLMWAGIALRDEFGDRR